MKRNYDNNVNALDAGKVMAECLKSPRQSCHFKIFRDLGSIKAMYKYNCTLIFDDVNSEVNLTSDKYAFCAYDLAFFLHQEFGLNDFDLSMHGNTLEPMSTIRHDDVVHIDGFKHWTADNWNRLMHAINGNMEFDIDDFLEKTAFADYSDKMMWMKEQLPDIKIDENESATNSRAEFFKLCGGRINDDLVRYLWDHVVVPSKPAFEKVDNKAIDKELRELRALMKDAAEKGIPFCDLKVEKNKDLAMRIYHTFLELKKGPKFSRKERSAMISKVKLQQKLNIKRSLAEAVKNHNLGIDIDPHKEVKVHVNKVTMEGEPSGLALEDKKDFGDYAGIYSDTVDNADAECRSGEQNMKKEGVDDIQKDSNQVQDLDESIVEEKKEEYGILGFLFRTKKYIYDILVKNDVKDGIPDEANDPVVSLINAIRYPVAVVSTIVSGGILSVFFYALRTAVMAGTLLLDTEPLEAFKMVVKFGRSPLKYALTLLVIAIILGRTVFQHIQRHEIDIEDYVVEPRKAITQKREYDNHFETTKHEVTCNFTETVTDRLKISFGPLSLSIPYYYVCTEHTASLELVANILSPINMNGTLSPTSIIERVCKATNIGSFIDYDRAQVYEKDLIGGAQRLAIAVAFHFRCGTLRTNLINQVFQKVEDKLVLLPTDTLTRTLASSMLLSTFVIKNTTKAFTFMDTVLKTFVSQRLQSLMRPLLVQLNAWRRMMNLSVHQWLILVSSIYLLIRLVRM